MTSRLFRRSFVLWCAAGLTIWSCASSPGSGTSEQGRGGSSSGNGGAAAGVGGGGAGGVSGGAAGSRSVQGGAGQSTGGQSGSAAGGDLASGGTVPGAGGEPEGGTDGSGEGGAAPGGAGQGEAGEGGAGGSSDAIFEGRCGEGWAAGTTAGKPPLGGNVTPEVDKAGNWSFSFGRYRLVVAGKRGARVIELSIDGINLLEPTGGSTFWPSPQQAYTWPPPPEIDSSAYVAHADAASLTLTSAVAKSLGLSVEKRFWVNASSGIVSIEYQLVNEGSKSASWAPWEVTRVRAGGYTFAPRGPGSRTINQDSFQHPLPLSLMPPAPAPGGIEWLDYPGLTLTLDNYIAEFDGAEGWLAHANRLGKKPIPLLFVKSFADAADDSLPTNQAEIQLWTSGTADPKLIEVEQQGALRSLAPGASLTWTVRWSACELPSSVELAAGSSELAELARAHAVQP